MRKLLSTVFMMTVTGLTALAQDGMTTAPSVDYVLKVGPSLHFVGGGINTVNAEGRKINPDFMALPGYGVAIYAPFGSKTNLGARLDVGVTQFSTRMRPFEFYGNESNWNGYFTERYRYFTIAPTINLAGFLVGAGINIPMKATMEPSGGTEFVVDKTTLKTAIDIRIGGAIKVMENDLGVLNVEILARYFISGIYNDGQYTMGTAVDRLGYPKPGITTVENMVPASVSIGASYLFNLAF